LGRDPTKAVTIPRVIKSTNTCTKRKFLLSVGFVQGTFRRTNDEDVVETVTVTVAGLAPFKVTELGETTHVERFGVPVQPKETVWLKPPSGKRDREYVADWPAVTVAVGATGAIEKSCPVPVSATVCGLPGALSLIVKVPVLGPLVVGSKKTPISQLEPGAKLLPQALSVPKSLGLVVTLSISSAALPLFITVTLFGSPDVPTYWLAKLALCGVTDTAGADMVVPLNIIDSGLSAALSVMLTVPLRVPEPVGVKVIRIVQELFTFTDTPFVQDEPFPIAKSPAFAPARATAWMFKVADPVFCRVTVCIALVVPRG